nr:MAG TPA: hypothetical protein [Caudoviricetes sp.]
MYLKMAKEYLNRDQFHWIFQDSLAWCDDTYTYKFECEWMAGLRKNGFKNCQLVNVLNYNKETLSAPLFLSLINYQKIYVLINSPQPA